MVVKGGMLPGGLETVGEDIERHRGVELVRCGRKGICEAGYHFPLSYLVLIEKRKKYEGQWRGRGAEGRGVNEGIYTPSPDCDMHPMMPMTA